MKIVSLVPSLTELLFELGLGDEMVGRTKFCIHPNPQVKNIVKIGGTKTVKVDSVAALNPDLIIANREENTKEDVEALREVCEVYVSDISNFDDALKAIGDIGHLTNRAIASNDLIREIRDKFFELQMHIEEPKSVAYLIWKDPLMTVGEDTFIHDMLARSGFVNIFEGKKRYPIVTLDDIKNHQPEYIFLSSEPFPFKDKHIVQFAKAVPNTKVVLVDGEYYSWYGSRMRDAAEYFLGLRKRVLD